MKNDALNHVECPSCYNARVKPDVVDIEPGEDSSLRIVRCCFCGNETRTGRLRLGDLAGVRCKTTTTKTKATAKAPKKKRG